MKAKETARKVNIEVSVVSGEMIVPPKKTKLVWGIILAAFGLIGLAGAGQMSVDGFIFYLSVNGVWLTKEVPVRYLKKLS